MKYLGTVDGPLGSGPSPSGGITFGCAVVFARLDARGGILDIWLREGFREGKKGQLKESQSMDDK